MSSYIAQLLDKRVTENGNDLTDYIPFISPSGDFSKVHGFDVIAHSWDVILSTREGSYIDDPNFGSKLYEYVFQPIDEFTADDVREEVLEKLTTYDDRAEISEVSVNFNTTYKEISIQVIASWQGKVNNYQFNMDENLAKIIMETEQR